MIYLSLVKQLAYMLTLYEYNQLSLDDKASYLWNHGRYLVNRSTSSHRVNLYSLHSYYIEVWYNDQSNEIDQLRSFSSSNQLTPYLSLFEITDL